jgi:hypothetical protein
MSDLEQDEKGFIGFYYGGALKIGRAYLFWCGSNDLQIHFNGLQKFYGENVTCRYIDCDEPKKMFEEFEKTHVGFCESGQLYNMHVGTVVAVLKKATGNPIAQVKRQ